MRRKIIGQVALVLVAVLLLFAWVDGGREPQRLIEQPVTLGEGAQ